MLQGMLAPLGYRLTFATSGQQSIDRARASRPDLILLDMMMPGMNGIDVCDHLKASPDTAEIPVMFLTASSDIDALTAAFDRGAIDYITKPFRSEELVARIKTHLELATLRRQAQIEAKQEKMMRELVTGIHQSLDLDRILHGIAASLREVLNADRVSIARARPNPTQPCEIFASTDASLEEERFVFDLTPRDRPQIGVLYCCSDGDDDRERAWFARCCVELEYRLPVFQGETLWGAIVVHRSQTPIRTSEAALLEPVVTQLGVAIERAELHEQLQAANTELMRLTNIDGLTEIANRRALERYLDSIWPRLSRNQQPLSAIAIDIDYFKHYNDRYGHIQGDACLKAIARTLSDTFARRGEFVARYGSEEFCVMLPKTDADRAVKCAQRVQNAIALLELEHHDRSHGTYVTVSVGVATEIPDDDATPQALLEAADMALYNAKQAGRNCIRTASNTQIESPSLNVEIGLRRSGQDTGLYRDLLEIFLQIHVDFEARFRQAWQGEDRDRPFYLVNTLRGGASNIGALSLEAAALALESKLQQEVVSSLQVESSLDRVVRELASVCRAIEAFADTLNDSLDR